MSEERRRRQQERQKLEERRKGKAKIWELVFTAVLAVLPFAWSKDVPLAPYGILCLAASWLMVLHLLFTLPRFEQWSVGQKLICAIYLTIFVAELVAAPLGSRYREEQAAMTEGYIHSRIAGWGAMALQVGRRGGSVPWGQGDTLKMFSDTYLGMERGEDGIEISTVIHDRNGAIVATIEKNHWRVTSYCLDKNYSDDSLEILDSRGHIVFQVTILSDRVQIQGEWHNEFGWGIRMSDAWDGTDNGVQAMWKTPEQERKIEQLHLIEPIFRYPSKEHWKEMVSPHS